MCSLHGLLSIPSYLLLLTLEPPPVEALVPLLWGVANTCLWNEGQAPQFLIQNSPPCHPCELSHRYVSRFFYLYHPWSPLPPALFPSALGQDGSSAHHKPLSSGSQLTLKALLKCHLLCKVFVVLCSQSSVFKKATTLASARPEFKSQSFTYQVWELNNFLKVFEAPPTDL